MKPPKGSPTKHAKMYCEQKGWPCWDVELWIPGTRIRRDLFNFIDLIALTPSRIKGIQVTSDNGGNMSARMKKAEAQEHYGAWTQLADFEVWGFRPSDARLRKMRHETLPTLIEDEWWVQSEA